MGFNNTKSMKPRSDFFQVYLSRVSQKKIILLYLRLCPHIRSIITAQFHCSKRGKDLLDRRLTTHDANFPGQAKKKRTIKDISALYDKERERKCVCVCACGRERERERERED